MTRHNAIIHAPLTHIERRSRFMSVFSELEFTDLRPEQFDARNVDLKERGLVFAESQRFNKYGLDVERRITTHACAYHVPKERPRRVAAAAAVLLNVLTHRLCQRVHSRIAALVRKKRKDSIQNHPWLTHE